MKKAEKVEKKKPMAWEPRAYPAGSIVIHGGVPFRSKWNTDKNDAPIDYERDGGRDFALSRTT